MANRTTATRHPDIPNPTSRIVAIARVTHPMMMRLTGSARYKARAPRNVAAGFPP